MNLIKYRSLTITDFIRLKIFMEYLNLFNFLLTDEYRRSTDKSRGLNTRALDFIPT